jgi:hypothetical protein
MMNLEGAEGSLAETPLMMMMMMTKCPERQGNKKSNKEKRKEHLSKLQQAYTAARDRPYAV